MLIEGLLDVVNSTQPKPQSVRYYTISLVDTKRQLAKIEFSSIVDNLVCRPRSADVIDLEEDDSKLSPHFASPAPLRKRCLTTSEHDDLEFLEGKLVEGTHSELEIVSEDH